MPFRLPYAQPAWLACPSALPPAKQALPSLLPGWVGCWAAWVRLFANKLFVHTFVSLLLGLTAWLVLSRELGWCFGYAAPGRSSWLGLLRRSKASLRDKGTGGAFLLCGKQISLRHPCLSYLLALWVGKGWLVCPITPAPYQWERMAFFPLGLAIGRRSAWLAQRGRKEKHLKEGEKLFAFHLQVFFFFYL